MDTMPLGLLPSRQKLNMDWPAQDQPLVSVVIPSYNHARFVTEAVMSVVHQTWPNIQLIVIDDGSLDESSAILSRLSKEQGFHFISRTNRGVSATLNQGLALAQGKYFCPFASDDIMLPERFERQLLVMEKNPSIAVCDANMQLIDQDGKMLGAIRQPSGDIRFADFCEKGNCLSAPAVMIRKSVLAEVGGYDEDIRVEDLAMWMKLSYHGYRLYRIEDVVVHYRRHLGNSNKYEEEAKDVARIYAKYAEYQGIRRQLLVVCARIFWTDPVGIWQIIRSCGRPAMLGSLLVRVCAVWFYEALQIPLHLCRRIYRLCRLCRRIYRLCRRIYRRIRRTLLS